MSAAEKRKEERMMYSSSAYIEKEYFGGADDALITNISTNGISLQTVLPLSQDEYVSIQIENPTNYEKLRILGEVSWVDKTDENTLQVGVEIAPMDKTLREKFEKLLENINTKYEPTNPRASFDAGNGLQAEIEKILQIESPEAQTVKAKPQLVEKSEVPNIEKPLKFKTTPIIQEPDRNTTVSFFTIILLILLVIAGAIAYYMYAQIKIEEEKISNNMHESILQNKKIPATKLAPNEERVTEQKLDQKGNPIADTPPQKTPINEATIEKTTLPVESGSVADKLPELQLYPYQGARDFEKTSWIKKVSWMGNETQVTIKWVFDRSIDTKSVTIQKLDFDPNNIRYLVRVPAPDQVLNIKEIQIDHPLTKQVRMGLHGTKSKQLHLVFDVANPNIKLSQKVLDAKTLVLEFNQ